VFSLDAYLAERRRIVNEALLRYLGDAKPGNETIYRAVAYSLHAEGKRVRGILALATAEALHMDHERVLPLACALEMIHTYSLIHDDLPSMDDDDLRRGKPTNHKVFGEACAILAGDALLTKAFEILTLGESVPLEVIREVAKAAGIDGMVGGQMMDLEAEDRAITVADLERIHRHKTGALLRCSVLGSAKWCQASARQLENLDAYGRAVGLAFQIADDVLDIEGKDIGKPVGSDVEKEKSTYPKIFGLAQSKEKAKTLVAQALEALKDFDEAALALREIARFIVDRKK
jgi:geranylgeranyl diphosphate synthase type II